MCNGMGKEEIIPYPGSNTPLTHQAAHTTHTSSGDTLDVMVEVTVTLLYTRKCPTCVLHV